MIVQLKTGQRETTVGFESLSEKTNTSQRTKPDQPEQGLSEISPVSVPNGDQKVLVAGRGNQKGPPAAGEAKVF